MMVQPDGGNKGGLMDEANVFNEQLQQISFAFFGAFTEVCYVRELSSEKRSDIPTTSCESLIW